MVRRRMLQAFEAAKTIGNYADVPVMPVDVDPQIILSRNTERQPFYLVFEEDTVIAVMAGHGHVRLRDSNVNSWMVKPGDHIYVPGGTPHRLEPSEECVLVRFVGNEPRYRGAVFACDACGAEIDRLEWVQDLDSEAIALYAQLATNFNADLDRRTCARCGTVAEEISLERLGWVASSIAES